MLEKGRKGNREGRGVREGRRNRRLGKERKRKGNNPVSVENLRAKEYTQFYTSLKSLPLSLYLSLI